MNTLETLAWKWLEAQHEYEHGARWDCETAYRLNRVAVDALEKLRQYGFGVIDKEAMEHEQTTKEV